MIVPLLIFSVAIGLRLWQPGWAHVPEVLAALMWGWLGWRAGSALIHMLRAPHPVLQAPRALFHMLLAGAAITFARASAWLVTGAGWTYGRETEGAYRHYIFRATPGWYQVSLTHPWQMSLWFSAAAALAAAAGILLALLWPKRFGLEHWFLVRLAAALREPDPPADQHVRGSARRDHRGRP